MIDVGQWRCAIGVFMFSNRKPKCGKSKTKSTQNKEDLTDLCGQLFVLAIIFWAINLEYQCINYFSTNTNPNCLMLSGDVESNPGPTMEERVQEMQQSLATHMQMSFQKLSEQIEEQHQRITRQLTEQSQRITDTHQHVMSIEHSVTYMKLTLTNMQTRIQTLEEDQRIQQLDGIENSEATASLGDRLEKVEHDMEQKAREERKPNVILHDVKEHLGDNDTNESITKHTVLFLNQHVPSKVWSHGDIKNCFRMGTRVNNIGKTRPILVSFNTFKDKLNVLKTKDYFKTINVGVSADLTPYQRDELRKLKSQNKFGFYKQGKLVVTEDRFSLT